MRLLVVLMFLLFGFSTQAQKYLVIKKKSKTKQVFESGDYIKFKVKGERHWRKQLIVGFLEDGIRFHYFDVLLEDIAIIKRPKKDLKLGVSNSLIMAGVGYLLVDQFNQTVIRDEPFEVSESTIIVTSSFVALGVFMKLFARRNFKIDRINYRLETSDYIP